MKNKKKIVSIVALLLIVVLIVTATYAYFAAKTGEGSSTDINITAGTVDNLTFETGDTISINASQSNFATGMNSLSDDTYAKATLIANNDTNSASANYYVYLNISSNEFVYTTSDSTAELILSITMDGTEVTSLDGYDYVSVTDGNSNVISGFDITTASGLVTIADNYLIESTGIEVDDWEITVTFVNLDSDQSGNAGKSFSASLMIQQEAMTLSNYVLSLYSEDGVNSLYYFDGEGDYTNSDLEAIDYSYRYSGSTDEVNNYVYFGSGDYYCYYDGNVVSSYSGNTVTESDCSNVYRVTDAVYSEDYVEYYSDELMDMYLYNDPVSVSWDSESSTCVIDSLSGATYYLYTWYNYTPTESECTGVAYQWQNGSYYYLGFESVGSGEWEEYYTDDNLYRIIGLFLNDDGNYEVKLIKWDYANSDLLGTDGDYSSNTYSSGSYSTYEGVLSTINRYYWSYKNMYTSYDNTTYYNDWGYSYLNTINLNTNYLNNIGEKWSNLITTHAWIVGGGPDSSSDGVNSASLVGYSYEIENYNTLNIVSIYQAKIGLIYVSDYAYAVDSTYWSTATDSYNVEAYEYDWIYTGINEWTITRSVDYVDDNFSILSNGTVITRRCYDYAYAVRPTFYLNSSVVYTGGSGTLSDPYTIS